jgi:hypothetical protein
MEPREPIKNMQVMVRGVVVLSRTFRALFLFLRHLEKVSAHLFTFLFTCSDITLAISNHKTNSEWLDRFVQMTDKQHTAARGWVEYFEAKYPVCGKLNVWEQGDCETWPELTDEEKERFEKGCVIM